MTTSGEKNWRAYWIMNSRRLVADRFMLSVHVDRLPRRLLVIIRWFDAIQDRMSVFLYHIAFILPLLFYTPFIISTLNNSNRCKITLNVTFLDSFFSTQNCSMPCTTHWYRYSDSSYRTCQPISRICKCISEIDCSPLSPDRPSWSWTRRECKDG